MLRGIYVNIEKLGCVNNCYLTLGTVILHQVRCCSQAIAVLLTFRLQADPCLVCAPHLLVMRLRFEGVLIIVVEIVVLVDCSAVRLR
jgi:hypothetical protein